MVQMTMQLAALNGKDLTTEKRGKLWDKAAVDYFKFSSLTTISTLRLRTKIPFWVLPTLSGNTQTSLSGFIFLGPCGRQKYGSGIKLGLHKGTGIP
jgi:hypothetical protein